jgi:ABC-type glycerol-3-phosphate transport system substrate-binding protein
VHAVRRLAVVLVAVLALAACGGGSSKSSDADQVKSAWTRS